MKNAVEGHLTNFGSIADTEESPEMEAERDDLCGLSLRDIHDFEEGFARKIRSHKKKQVLKKIWRTR